MKTTLSKRILTGILAFVLIAVQMWFPPDTIHALADGVNVVTLGADLSEEQRRDILEFFGVDESQVQIITVTNAEEKELLGGHYTDAEIGTKTFSCAYIRLTNQGGVQAKIGNLTVVRSEDIAQVMVLAGVNNCEVLTAAPFAVSGTGALTGVMKAYEQASGTQLDPEKKDIAVEAISTNAVIAEKAGKEAATLIINDTVINVVRGGLTERDDIVVTVDDVIAATEQAAAETAEKLGYSAPQKLDQSDHELLYDFGEKVSRASYNYNDMKPTLQRVTRAAAQEAQIEDPIISTFDDSDLVELSADSILLGTDDTALGENAVINATSDYELETREADEIEVFTGEVTLTEAGKVKAEQFISGTNVVSYKDLNGSYALMDLDGNILTDSVYTRYFNGRYRNIVAELDDGSSSSVILNAAGKTAVPAGYPVTQILSEKWAAGYTLKPGTADDYDFYSGSDRYQIDTVDLYHIDEDGGVLAGTLSRDQFAGSYDVYAYQDYLNVKDRAGNCTLYDASFSVVDHPDNLYQFKNSGNEELAKALEEYTGYSVWSYSFYGDYVKVTDYNASPVTYGVADRYGNIILPVIFENVGSFYESGVDDSDSYLANGYFAVEQNDCLAYAIAGGTVTAAFPYAYNDVRVKGMCAYYEDGDTYILLAADGTETSLGTDYTYLDTLSGSKGMLWKACRPDGDYDLIDWHGNVLVEDSSDYSLSADGNYLIAQNGYTSSTLYLVNDAPMVKLPESAGAAVEVEAAFTEAASLDVYTGDPVVTLVSDTVGTGFINGTDLMVASNDQEHYALIDVAGNQLTEPVYSNTFEYDEGWLIARKEEGENQYKGLLSLEGAEIIPCQYDEFAVLDEEWAIGYYLSPGGTEDDHDYTLYNSNNTTYYLISQADVYHISDTEVAYVSLSRDQISGVGANGGYINIQNRESGLTTQYDANFNAVASVNSYGDFDNVSAEHVLAQQLTDQTGYHVNDSFSDGYTTFYGYFDGTAKLGIMDMSGNIILQPQYDNILANYPRNGQKDYMVRGYFTVEQEDKIVFVSAGDVITSEPVDKVSNNNYFINNGLSGKMENEDGTYTLVAADGTVTDGYGSLSNRDGIGLFYEDYTDNKLIDWHGNTIFEDYYDVFVSWDANYILLQKEWKSPMELYVVDGAEIPDKAKDTQQEDVAEADADADAVAGTDVDTDAGADTLDEDTSTEASTAEADVVVEDATAADTDAAIEDAAVADTDAAIEDTAATDADTVIEDAAAADTDAVEKMEEDPSGTAQTQVDASPAVVLFNTAYDLYAADPDQNGAAVLALLQQASGMLETENPAVAAVLNSAVTLLGTDGADSNAVTTLMETAKGMIQ